MKLLHRTRFDTIHLRGVSEEETYIPVAMRKAAILEYQKQRRGLRASESSRNEDVHPIDLLSASGAKGLFPWQLRPSKNSADVCQTDSSFLVLDLGFVRNQDIIERPSIGFEVLCCSIPYYVRMASI